MTGPSLPQGTGDDPPLTPARAAPASAARVLVVEDDFRIASNLDTFLSLKGFGVDAAYSGQAALHRCSIERFDVILLDIGCPGLTA